MEIFTQTFPATVFVFTNLKGVSQISKAAQRLQNWAKNSLPEAPQEYVLMYLDSFRDTPPEEVRMRFGLFLPEPLEGLAKDMHCVTLEETPVLSAKLLLKAEDFGEAWREMHNFRIGQNIPLGQNPPFEIHHRDPQEHPQKLHEVTLMLPISKQKNRAAGIP